MSGASAHQSPHGSQRISGTGLRRPVGRRGGGRRCKAIVAQRPGCRGAVGPGALRGGGTGVRRPCPTLGLCRGCGASSQYGGVMAV